MRLTKFLFKMAFLPYHISYSGRERDMTSEVTRRREEEEGIDRGGKWRQSYWYFGAAEEKEKEREGVH